MMRSRPKLLASCAAGALVLTGCAPGGVGALPLPGTEGRLDGAYTVQVELTNASDLYPNTRVLVDNVNVGSVTEIRVEGWHAEATVTLNEDVQLPANTQARIGQTSLLGAKHLELSPPGAAPAQGRLSDGDTIPLERSRNYPGTEEVLAGVSLLLNGGGLEQIKTITTELTTALGNGRAAKARQTLEELDALTSTLDRQRHDINDALDGLDRLARQAKSHEHVIDKVLTQIPRALETLNEERTAITGALDSLATLSDSATGIVTELRGTLTRNLEHLAPVLRELADSGDALVGSTGLLLTGLFPLKTNKNLFKGDYASLSIIVDLTDSAISKYYLSLLKGTPVGDILPGLGTSSGNPFQAPPGGKYEGMGGSGPLPTPPDTPADNPSESAGSVNGLVNMLSGGLTGGLVGGE